MSWSRRSNPAALTQQTHQHSLLLLVFLTTARIKLHVHLSTRLCLCPPACLFHYSCLFVCFFLLLQLLEPVPSSLPLWAGRGGAEVTWSVYLSNHTVQVSALSVRSRGWTWRKRRRNGRKTKSRDTNHMDLMIKVFNVFLLKPGNLLKNVRIWSRWAELWSQKINRWGGTQEALPLQAL